jgi:competence protein ComEC
MKKGKKGIVLTSGIVVVLGICLAAYIINWEFRKPALDIFFFHLNRGRSVFIRTPENQTILIDGGQTTDIIRELTRVIPFYRRRIDMVVLTSAAPKNAGGLLDVVRRYDIGTIIESQLMGTSTALSALEKIVEEKGIKTKDVGMGDEWMIESVKFTVLFPDINFKFNKTNKPDMVLSVSSISSSTTVLLLGDVSKTIQKTFIPLVGKVDVVEYSHSAADSRVSKELFDRVNPDTVIITKKVSQTDAPKALQKTKKKFDIDLVDKDRVFNLEERGTVHLTFPLTI